MKKEQFYENGRFRLGLVLGANLNDEEEWRIINGYLGAVTPEEFKEDIALYANKCFNSSQSYH
jgi:hypothetical protein